jgi:hypothetical protein
MKVGIRVLKKFGENAICDELERRDSQKKKMTRSEAAPVMLGGAMVFPQM